MDVGTVINHYRVVEHIGRGGMADVWSARDTRLNRMVAVKTIQAGLTGETDPIQLFEREAKTIAQLEHPHILPIYDFGEIQGQLYIVMRYVTGGSLEDVLEKGPLPFAEVLRVGQAIAGALDYAHMNKVVHLDLKPPNILLDSQSAPYLADFGLAAALGPEGRAANPGSGTLLYMAPEQLTEEQIDHRADIYSFAVMMFHMLTGKLPFDAAMPLALKQLQYQEPIPDVDLVNPDVPPMVTTILRRGTAVEPKDRPSTLTALFEDMRDALSGVTPISVGGEWDEYGGVITDGVDMLTEPMIDTDDMALLEAVDLFSRARHTWARGTGRFLLGVTHYMLMSGYYSQAQRYGLDIDESGLQMMLRGALEYDHDLDFWWGKLDNDNRRWVCLHAVRSENAPARIRALFRLETLPDSEAQQIPRIVAQALQAETTEEGKLAAIRVLGTRSRLMAVRPEYDVQSLYRARLLTSFTRIVVQQRAPSEWREAVYTPEIDKLVAEVALTDPSVAVSSLAARTIGQMRSLSAVRFLAEQQRMGAKGALYALALVRDEAPSLPPIVDRRGRWYAWIANTWRRLSDQPMSIVWRFVFALLGSWLAIGTSVYLTYNNSAILYPLKMGSSLGFGLIFGLITALLVVSAVEIPSRLSGFWTWWTRLLVSVIFGFLFGTLAWSAYSYLFLYAEPDWDLMIFGGLAFTFGLTVSAQFNIRGWAAVGLLTSVFFLTIYVPYYHWCSQVYVCFDAPPFSMTPFALVTLIIGGVSVWLSRVQNPRALSMFTFSVRWASWLKVLVSVLLGVLWTTLVWSLYGYVLATGFMTWRVLITVLLLSALLGIVVIGAFGKKERIGFYAAAITSFVAASFAWNPYFYNLPIFPLTGGIPSALLYYNLFQQIFTIALPVSLMIALGTHANTVFKSVMKFVGAAPADSERSEALSAYLIVMLILSGFALFVALFGVPTSLATALVLAMRGWDVVLGYPLLAVMVLLIPFFIVWTGGTVLATLGVWRSKKWGAYGLIASLAFFVVYRAALAFPSLAFYASHLSDVSAIVGAYLGGWGIFWLALTMVGIFIQETFLAIVGGVLLVAGVRLLRENVPQMAMTVGSSKPKTQPKIAPVTRPLPKIPAELMKAKAEAHTPAAPMPPVVPQPVDMSTQLDPMSQPTDEEDGES
jgi:hypothetical protein